MTRKNNMVEPNRGEAVEREQQSFEQQSTDSKTPRWTLWGHSVLPTTVEGGLAVLFTVLWPFWPVPALALTAFGAPIFLFLGVRKGDRALLLVLPLLASILLLVFAITFSALMVWKAIEALVG